MDMKAISAKLVQGLKESAPEVIDALAHSCGVLGVLKGLAKAVPHVVENVEAEGKAADLTGADKKALALEILNALPIPWPFWVAPFKAALLEGAVEMAVSVFNRYWKK